MGSTWTIIRLKRHIVDNKSTSCVQYMTTERQRNLDLLYELGGERFTDWDVHCSKLSKDRHTDTRPSLSVLVHTQTHHNAYRQTHRHTTVTISTCSHRHTMANHFTLNNKGKLCSKLQRRLNGELAITVKAQMWFNKEWISKSMANKDRCQSRSITCCLLPFFESTVKAMLSAAAAAMLVLAVALDSSSSWPALACCCCCCCWVPAPDRMLSTDTSHWQISHHTSHNSPKSART